MNKEEFNKLYMGEFETRLPKDGYLRVLNRSHAHCAAEEFNLKRQDWQYIQDRYQLMGLEIPGRKYFYFICADIPIEEILVRIRR